MAKSKKKGVSMDQDIPDNAIIISMEFKPKLDKYCQVTFGKSFDEAFDDRLAKCANEFVEGIKAHIKEAEKAFGKDYLEIKE